MVLNLIIILLIIVATMIGIRWYLKRLDVVDDEDIDINDTGEMDLDYIIRDVKKTINDRQKRQVVDENISSDEAKRRRNKRRETKKAIRLATNGDFRSRKILRSYIKEIIFNEKYDLTNMIDDYIPFKNPNRLSGNDLFEIVVYMFNREYGIEGYSKMMSTYRSMWENVFDESIGEKRHFLGKQAIREIYDDIMDGDCDALTNNKLTFDDKVEILAFRICEKAFGFGIVDILYESNVDEIDGGVSGVSADGYTGKQTDRRVAYSYESVWVVYSGSNVHLECCSFESQRELIRVVSNIYRFNAPYVLSRLKAAVVSSMIDGSRIVAVRPPFADSWAFFLRKFDSAPSVKLVVEKGSNEFALLREENGYLAVALLRLLIRGQRNIAFTGSQGTGKTTFLKAAIRYIDPAFNLRIQELQFELNLRFAFPKRNVVTFQETAELDAQFGLNLQKKTNGSVNIIGEVANAVQAGFIIQTARVASLMALFTHHAKTPVDLVEAISDNLLQLRLYADKKDAVAATAGILNIDWHLTNDDGNRHVERVTEIIPLQDVKYPSEAYRVARTKEYIERFKEDHHDMSPTEWTNLPIYYQGLDEATALSYEERTYMDAPEYFKRVTDPELFETRQLLHWEQVDMSDPKAPGRFVLDALPTEETLSDMLKKISDVEERKNFKEDVEMLKQLIAGKKEEEIEGFDKWKHKIISY